MEKEEIKAFTFRWQDYLYRKFDGSTKALLEVNKLGKQYGRLPTQSTKLLYFYVVTVENKNLKYH